VFTPRIIVTLLLSKKGLVKTIKFKDPTYVGDPINAVKIFNDKEVHELVFLNIDRSNDIPYEFLDKVASECFFPFAYGGNLRTLDQVKRVMDIGLEKVVFNSSIIKEPNMIEESSKLLGSQSVVASIDVKKRFFGGYYTYIHNEMCTGLDPVYHAKRAVNLGCGEIILTSIDQEGTQNGYDCDLIKQVSDSVSVPVVANGGASCLEDMKKAIDIGANASSASTIFVFYGPLRSVLIDYPSRDKINSLFDGENLKVKEL
jgi:cyclase